EDGIRDRNVTGVQTCALPMFKKFFIPILLMLFVFMLSACNDNGTHDTDAASEDKGSLKIAMNDWAENIAVSNMWKILLEERGYETELVQVEKAIMYQGVADKELDIGMEIWLPHTDKPYYDEYSDDIDLRDA